MDPDEVVLWPHGTHQVYDTFDRIFSCKGHGWANLQSMHINLPFAGDEEFGRLHAAIRLLVADPARACRELADHRRAAERDPRQPPRRVPRQLRADPVGHGRGRSGGRSARSASITSGCSSRSIATSSRTIPSGVLRHEWVNARGAIARFDRMAIEIRVLDVQETPLMDVAYAALIVDVLKFLCDER